MDTEQKGQPTNFVPCVQCEQWADKIQSLKQMLSSMNLRIPSSFSHEALSGLQLEPAAQEETKVVIQDPQQSQLLQYSQQESLTDTLLGIQEIPYQLQLGCQNCGKTQEEYTSLLTFVETSIHPEAKPERVCAKCYKPLKDVYSYGQNFESFQQNQVRQTQCVKCREKDLQLADLKTKQLTERANLEKSNIALREVKQARHHEVKQLIEKNNSLKVILILCSKLFI